jgi:SIR2-like domain
MKDLDLWSNESRIMSDDDNKKTTSAPHGSEEFDVNSTWPYATRFLLDTLDPALIERHAVSILSRALNIGRVTAFLGAGVSMSYGRIGWRALVETLTEKTLAACPMDETLKEYGKKYERITSLKPTLEALRSNEGARSDRYPMIFQVCAQLSDEITDYYKETKNKNLYQLNFRRDAIYKTKNDVGHTERILRGVRRKKWYNNSANKDDIDKILDLLQEIERSDPLFNFLFHEIRSNKKEGKKPNLIDNKNLPGFFDLLIAGNYGEKLLTHPTRRYLAGLYLSLLTQDAQDIILKRAVTTLDQNKGKKGHDRRREDAISLYRDPLRLLHERLKINRFLTTNYDREINLYLQSRMGAGQELGDTGSVPSANRQQMGSIREIVFQGEQNTGELIRFIAGEPGGQAGVVQLHGSVMTGDIVVSETDYQKLYLKPGPDRDLIDNAIRFTFGANPLLFVGSNMSEDDLLRPLRQFMSTPSSFGEKVAIALIPGTAKENERTEEKISLLGRYGVYAIHFGAAHVENSAEHALVPNWLELAAKLKSYAWDVLDCFCRITAKELRRKKAAEGQRQKILNKSKFDNKSPWDENFSAPYQQIFEREQSGIIRFFRVTRIEDCEVDVTVQFDVDLEIEIFNTAFSVVKEIIDRSSDLFIYQEIVNLQKKGKAFKLALEGAWDAILAAFTCARLLKVRRDWDQWNKTWFEVPKPRQMRISCDVSNVWPKSNVSPEGNVWSNLNAHNEEIRKLDPKQPQLDQILSPQAQLSFRHLVWIPSEPDHRHFLGPFYASAPSESYRDLGRTLKFNALASRFFRNSLGRRVMWLVAERGAGKGRFFSTLLNRSGGGRLPELFAALQPQPIGAAPVKWYGVGVYNMSYSNEIMTIFDRISDLLYRALLQIFRERLSDLDEQRLAGRWFDLRFDGLLRLTAMMDEWRKFGEASLYNVSGGACDNQRCRAFIALNAVGNLFDRDGRPKNPQIDRIFDALIGDDNKRAPIDFLFFSRPENIPEQLRHGSKAKSLVHLISPTRNARSEALLNARAAQMATLSKQELENRLPMAVQPEAAIHDHASGLYFVRPARIAVVALGFLPRVTFLIARRVLWEGQLIKVMKLKISGLLDKDKPYAKVFDDKLAVAERKAIGDCLTRIGRWQDVESWIAVPVMTVLATMALELGVSCVGTILTIFVKMAEADPNIGIMDPIGKSDSIAYRMRISNTVQSQLIYLAARLINAIVELKLLYNGTVDQCLSNSNTCVPELEIIMREHNISVCLSASNGVSEGGSDKKFLEKLSSAFRATTMEYDDQMRKLFDYVGRGRIALTYLLAGAYEGTAELSFCSPEPTREDVDKVMERVDHFIERATHRLKMTPQVRKADVVIDEVLKNYERHHRDRHKLLYKIAVKPYHGDQRAHAEIDRADLERFYLMQDILWYLSIIGEPIEKDILYYCPEIRRRALPLAAEWMEGVGNKEFVKRQKFYVDQEIENVLGLAVARCLVFRINPIPPDDTTRPAEEFRGRHRFAVHRLLQRHFIASVATSPREVPEWDQFTVSLYASQPDDLPQISPKAHQKIFEAIKALSGYPDDRGLAQEVRFMGKTLQIADTGEPELKELELHGRLLRAAYGIVRTIYSVGVLSHLQEHEQLLAEGEKPFEQYRRLIRWIIWATVNLTHQLEDLNRRDRARHDALPPQPRDPESGAATVLPFYAEELVWLYNECGVLSLVEGILPDALALFEMALRVAQNYLEASETGPIHVAIYLNQAVLYIERGRGEQFRATLQQIIAAHPENSLLWLLASGYVAVLDHISGNLEAAGVAYERVINELAKKNQSRAAALFAKYLGDLYRADQRQGPEVSAYWFEQALHLAQKGKHIDVYHEILLSSARVDIESSKDQAPIHRTLDAVERYGLQLGLLRVLAETAELRASLLLKQGERHLALVQATRSLEIANQNDLRLRKARALAVLAEVYIARDQSKQARHLVESGVRLAESIPYNAVLKKLQELQRRIGL